MSANGWPMVPFGEFLKPNKRPYTLGPAEDANLVGMRLYGYGPFHREFKLAGKIRKKTHFVIRANDVIYNKLFAWKGTFGIVPDELDGMFVSDKFPTYELNEERVDRSFLKWYFRFPPLWEQARQMSTGSAALSKLTLNPPRFLDLTMPLPPLSEQRRIVAKIEQLAQRIDEAKRLRDRSACLVSAVLPSKLNRVCESLVIDGRLSDVLLEKPRNGWSARCDNASDGIPVLTLSAVTGFVYDSTAIKRTSEATQPDAHYWLRKGDLLVTRSNTPDLVGHAAIYDGSPAPCIFPDLIMRVPVDESVAAKRFVWYWMRSPVVRKYIQEKAKGTSPTMKKIAQGTVMDIPFPTHLPVPKQEELVARLDQLQSTLTESEDFRTKSSAKLDALLPSILDRAFKGEL